MLRPLVLAARTSVRASAALRPLSTSPFPDPPDRLTHLLGGGDDASSPGTTAAIWGGDDSDTPAFPFPAPTDPDLANPPVAPAGSLPAGTAPTAAPGSRAHRLKLLADHQLPHVRLFHLHVLASRNNTILTLTDERAAPRAWVSAGLCGFKKVQRSGYEAGYQCAVRMFARIAEEIARASAPLRLEIAFKGYGFGREAVFRALMATEGDKIRDTVFRLKDTTPIKIGGTKARKARRL